MPVAYPTRKKEKYSPDRSQVPIQSPEPPPDEWTQLKYRYVQPFMDMMDTLKSGYDNLVGALGGTASPRRK